MATLLFPTETTLPNGIPVLFQDCPGSVAATYWWVSAGSADERPSEAGFAHFLEHMHFKDSAAKQTGRPSSGKLARAIESLGGEVNAYTSFEQTVYHATCSETHWEKVASQLLSMAEPQRFLRTDFEREREVILEELRMFEDSPERQLFQGIFGEGFLRHPYGRPVIGFSRTLRSAKVADLESFYARNYVGNRMGIVFVGPLGAEGTRERAAREKVLLQMAWKRLGRARKGKGDREKRVSEPLERKMRGFRARAFPVASPSFGFAFRVPGLSDPRIPALDVIADTLGSGELSRLYLRLFQRDSLVTSISGGLYVPRDPGILYVQGETTRTDGLSAVMKACGEEIGRMVSDGPSAEELERVVARVESEKLYATQTADGMAGRIAFLRFVMNDLGFDQRYLDRIRALDAEGVRDCASEVFRESRLCGSILFPKAEPAPPGDELALALTRSLSGKQSQAVRARAHAPVATWSRPSGMRVVLEERRHSNVVAAHLSALGGLRLELSEGLRHWGASPLLGDTWTKGTRRLKGNEILAVLEGRAASLEGFSGRNTVGLQFRCLARDWPKLSELLAEVAAEPIFPDDEVSHSRRVAEERIRSIEDHASQVCSKLFLETLYETHPYGRFPSGSLESIGGIGSASLKEIHSRWIQPGRLVLSIAGNARRDQAEKLAGEIESRLSAQASPARLAESAPRDETDLGAPRWVEKGLGREQRHVIVGGLGTRIADADRHALRLGLAVLGGQSGRLFMELREKRSLAYSVSPVSFEGIERGYVGTYIGCAPEKVEEAVAGIRSVTERFFRIGPEKAELSRAREYALGRRAMDLQSDGSRATSHGLQTLYGLPIETDEEYARIIRGIGPKDVRRACERLVAGGRLVTAIAG